jgi:non-heme chloroperoxidase
MTTAGSSTLSSDKTITEHELEQCERANQTGRTPVVFVHGLWLLPSSGTTGRSCSRRAATWP